MQILNFHPKKRFSQNFLIDKNIILKILKLANLSKEDVVLEIGPGKGILTKELSNIAKKIIAVELDKKLYEYLKEYFNKTENVELFNEDILEFDLPKYLKKKEISKKIIVMGNIPYSITAPILEFIFKNIKSICGVYIMVQKELAKRLAAKPNTKDYSSVSCFTQFHTDVTLLFPVRRTCFRPQPKVDSYVIKLEPIDLDSRPKDLIPKDQELLFRIIRTAFNQRRKNLLNSLSAVLEKEEINKILSDLNIDWRLRAENLSLRDFVRISNSLVSENVGKILFDTNPHKSNSN